MEGGGIKSSGADTENGQRNSQMMIEGLFRL